MRNGMTTIDQKAFRRWGNEVALIRLPIVDVNIGMLRLGVTQVLCGRRMDNYMWLSGRCLVVSLSYCLSQFISACEYSSFSLVLGGL